MFLSPSHGHRIASTLSRPNEELGSYLTPVTAQSAGRIHPSPKQPTHHQMLKVNWQFYRATANPPSETITNPQRGAVAKFSFCLDRSLHSFKGTQFLQILTYLNLWSWVFLKENSCSATPEITSILWNPKVYNRVLNSPTLPLSWARWTQSTFSQQMFRSILILS
jgi:hypothetical protein